MPEAIFCYDTATVRFAIYPEGPKGERCVGEIAETALRDLFGARGGGDSLVQAYLGNAATIDARAMQRHREAAGRGFLLETTDFDLTDYCA
jgi:hypothetical protein